MTLIVPKVNRDGYRRHAAPESVQANLAAARRRLAEAQEEADWLEVLLARKLARFRAEGTWIDCDGLGKSCDHPPFPNCPPPAEPGRAASRKGD